MVKLNILGVVTEGFRLIRREPRAVLAWSGALFLTVGLSAWLVTSQIAPTFLAVAENSVDASTAMERLSVSFGLFPLAWLVGMAGYALVAAAILRAVLTPEDRRFFYLRLSKAELWLVLSTVVGFILFYIASIVATVIAAVVVAVPLAVIGFVSLEASPAFSLMHLAIILGVVAMEIAGFYVLMRFSMAPVMSFDRREFRLFESWSFTRGNGWRLVAVEIILMLGVLLLELLLVGAMLVSVGPGLFQSVADPLAVQALESLMNGMLRLFASPWGAVVLALISLVLGVGLTVCVAPFGRAYQLLRDAPAAA
jgi:hypothetical protein